MLTAVGCGAGAGLIDESSSDDGASTGDDDGENYEIERVVATRIEGKGRGAQRVWHVKWVGWGLTDEGSWLSLREFVSSDGLTHQLIEFELDR